VSGVGLVVDAQELSKVLGSYVTSVGYLRKCCEGRKRVDLTGAWVGEVSAEEARFARTPARLGRRHRAARATLI
jgi:sRNA-binding protein